MEYLETALDWGIAESDFWQMTIAEIDRAIESKIRVKKIQDRNKAAFDYALADLIGHSVARIYSSSATMPDISAAYPTLFTTEEIAQKKQEKQEELSVLRFKLFAKSHNQKFKEVGE